MTKFAILGKIKIESNFVLAVLRFITIATVEFLKENNRGPSGFDLDIVGFAIVTNANKVRWKSKAAFAMPKASPFYLLSAVNN